MKEGNLEEEIKNQVNEQNNELVHPLVEEKTRFPAKTLPILAAVLIIMAGIGTGFFLAQRGGVLPGGKPKVVKTDKMAGSTDTKTFKDVAEGTLEKGSAGEGTHKLVRSGGESQTVSLTSSVINLDDYVGKKVKIWGETFAAQAAGWLMDVGRLEVLQ